MRTDSLYYSNLIKMCSLFRKIVYLTLLYMSFNCFLQMNNGSETDNVDGEGNNFLFNMTHILYQGILLCGPDIVCDKTILTNLHIPSNFSAGSLCPNCSCSEECIFDQSIKCCPDVYFRYGFLECKSMNVLNKEADVRYPVISACPIDSTFDLSSNCGKQKWGDFEQIYNPPVISKNKNIIYENEFCAICHNETNYDKLNFSLKCPQNIDVNYISSLSALLDLAKKKKCEIKNEHPSVSNNVCSQPDKKISVCNATRNWKIFDQQIAMACQSAYDFPLGAFKNMFCTICNPPEFTTHILIENCPLNSSFGDTCLDHQTLEASFPYKNYFCLACNLGYDNVGHFNDVHVLSSIESYNEQDNLPYSITIEFLYLSKSIRNYVEQLTLQSDAQSAYATRSMITEIPKGNKMHVLKLNRYACIETGSSWFPFASVPIPHYSSVNYSINLTNLAEVGFAMTRSSSCTQGLLEPYTLSLQTNCSCTIGCVSDCCDDFALIQSWACISEKYSGYENGNTEKNHRVIDNCPYTNPYVNLCSNKTFSHFYHQVPVRVLKDEFDETFLNLFCYLCGKKYEDITEEAVTNIRPWPLRISCAKYINYKYSLSLNHLIDVILKQKSCELSFQPPANTRSCEWSCGFDVASCNVSGTWKHFDDDVLIACEHTDIFTFGPVYHHHIGYKNKFCLICNPTESKFSSQIIDSCTTAKNETLVKACTSFPQSHACMNYKNIFCQQCNDVNNELGDCFFFSDEYEQEESDYHDTDFDYIHIGETRQTLTFFTPKDFDDSYFQSQEKNTKCSYDQIFDDFAKVCRNLSCFDGKHLQNKTCVSYFKMTTNLRYTLAVKITFTTLAYVNATVKQTLEVFKNHIKNFVNATCKNPKIEKIILLHHDSCNTVISSQAEVSLFFTFFVNSSVNRDEIEEQLNMFTSASANWDLLETITLNVTVSRSEYALLLPLLMWKLDKRTHCFVQEERPELGPTEFLNVVVSPLLICQSLILKDYEFGVDWTSIRDEYVYKGLQFSSSQFDIYNDGFRVCKTDIAVYVSKMREISLGFENIFFTMFNKTLSTFTIVCNCFSLSFLLLTLITYSMFPETRTLSGVNNMLLVFFLMLAQGNGLITTILRNPFYKIIASTLNHIVWLATFFWIQGCSFQMFRIFRQNIVQEITNTSIAKTVIKCTIYAIGLSVLIVVLNIAIPLILLDEIFVSYNKTLFLTYKTEFIVTLFGPLIFVLITSVTFYFCTALRLEEPRKDETSKTLMKQMSFFPKLLLLSFGFWLMKVLDTLIDVASFMYIADIFSGLHGMLIFYCFIFNGKVWEALTSFCRKVK